MARFKRAFFAYPGTPADLATTINTAVAEHQKIEGRQLEITAWPQMPIFGAAIPDEIRDRISGADILLCDVTVANPNVYYEIGFAIGLGKVIAPVVNVSFADAVQNLQKDGAFDVIGYRTYENSSQLKALFSSVSDTALRDLYAKPLNSAQPVYVMSALRKTDFVNAVVSSVKSAKLHFRSFDPSEVYRFSTINAIMEVSASAGVVVPFISAHIEDAERHNIRAALLAGLSHGFERKTVMLQLRTHDYKPQPADFRELVTAVRDDKDIQKEIGAFAETVLIFAQSVKTPKANKKASQLQKLTLGAIAAENEFRTLDDYFVKTSEFLKTERGEIEVVTGRKGSGKTAIFFMVRDSYRKQKNALVTDLKPESHQLTFFRSELKKALELGAFDHTLAAFWYFVILSEILISLKKELDYQAVRKPELMTQAIEIESELAKLGVQESGDFTTRLDRLGKHILEELKSRSQKGRAFTSDELTNIVFKGGIAKAKALAIKHSSEHGHLVLLFDNIDKGWTTDGVDEFDVRLVRLLIEALERMKRDFGTAKRDFFSVVFLRNDVYELLVNVTPDRGKTSVAAIDWKDRIKLKQVVYARLQSAVNDYDATFDALWNRFFVPTASGKPSFEYFIDHCLMRPRFLLNIIENAIANGINRGHTVVDEDDCIDSVRQHSHFLLNDFGYEIRDVSGLSAKILQALVGVGEYVTRSEILDRLNTKVPDPTSTDRAFRLLLWYGLLGVVDRNNDPKYIYDYEYSLDRLQTEIDLQKDEPLYVTNPAIHVALK